MGVLVKIRLFLFPCFCPGNANGLSENLYYIIYTNHSLFFGV